MRPLIVLSLCLGLLSLGFGATTAYADHCPDGMVHVEEPTDTRSGCAAIERDEEGKEKAHDWCSLAPDGLSHGLQDAFKAACNNHDTCYQEAVDREGARAEAARQHCDEIFLAKLNQKCETLKHPDPCKRTAGLYFIAVRLAGWIFWAEEAKRGAG